MLMIQMTGGMGNQMFVYAFYTALQQEGKEVCIEDFTHYKEIGRNDNRLEEIFPLVYKKATRTEYNRLTDSSLLPWIRVRRKLFGRKDKSYKEKEAIIFEKEAFEQEDCYFVGFWQSQRYFENVKEKLRKDFTFHWETFSDKAKSYRKQMEQTNSVSVHIRRGDYLNENFFPIYGGICTDAYYESAMAYMKKKYPDCIFYLFTDDAEWGRKQAGDNIVFADCTEKDDAYVDMALMACCKHNIVANSSFSWWGAWLNANPHKTVIMPARWLNSSEGQDIYYGLSNVKIDAQGVVTEETLAI